MINSNSNGSPDQRKKTSHRGPDQNCSFGSRTLSESLRQRFNELANQ